MTHLDSTEVHLTCLLVSTVMCPDLGAWSIHGRPRHKLPSRKLSVAIIDKSVDPKESQLSRPNFTDCMFLAGDMWPTNEIGGEPGVDRTSRRPCRVVKQPLAAMPTSKCRTHAIFLAERTGIWMLTLFPFLFILVARIYTWLCTPSESSPTLTEWPGSHTVPDATGHSQRPGQGPARYSYWSYIE